jgi:hypothetical protein
VNIAICTVAQRIPRTAKELSVSHRLIIVERRRGVAAGLGHEEFFKCVIRSRRDSSHDRRPRLRDCHTLPEPVHAGHIDTLAQSILRTAQTGERNEIVLQRIALMELSLAPRE